MRKTTDLRLLIAGAALLCGVALAADAPPPGVVVVPVRQVVLADTIEGLGTVTANESVALTATVTETVSAIHFDDGDRVSKGQLLVELSSREEHAQLEEARATVGEAHRQYQRIQSLAAREPPPSPCSTNASGNGKPRAPVWPPSSHGWPTG